MNTLVNSSTVDVRVGCLRDVSVGRTQLERRDFDGARRSRDNCLPSVRKLYEHFFLLDVILRLLIKLTRWQSSNPCPLTRL